MAIVDFYGNTMRMPTWASRVFDKNNVVNGISTGTAAADAFTGGGAVTWIGGTGDDRYYQVGLGGTVVEKANEGVDTVYVVSSYVMADNIENLEIGYADGVVGNTLANYMKGTARGESFDGAGGNDVLTGGGGGDTFIFNKNSGYDLITDFHTGPSSKVTINPDAVRLAGYTQFTTVAQAKAAMTQVGSDVVLKLDANNAIKFADTTVSAFTADNFQLAYSPSVLKTSFVDNFDSLSLWNGQTGGMWRSDYGWGGDRNAAMARTLKSNGEKQLYSDSTLTSRTTGEVVGVDPFSVKDGVLTIHADRVAADLVDDYSGYKFTSGLLSTRNSFTQTYGYFEARMEIPEGQGVWPAFWLYTTNSNGSELDIMENHGSDLHTVAIHDYATGKDAPLGNTFYTPDLHEGFHTYGVMWTAETVTWYLDGVAIKSIPTPPDMHGPMYMIVNLALDANTADTFQGAEMKVDYVKAYTLENMPESLTKTVSGGSGNDYLSGTTGADNMIGGTGFDTYYVDHAGDRITEKANEGTDTVRAALDWILGDNFENLTLVGSAVRGTGNDLSNIIYGNDRDNILTGGGGNDTINGYAGADRMIGGTGNDIYTVDNIGDVIVELANEGTDIVNASVDYTISANVETLNLTGSAIRGTGNDIANQLNGNAQANILTGGGGSDRLDGREGADTMLGGTGDDTYIVDNVKDVVVEKGGEGWDMVLSSVDYVMTDNVEQMSLTGTAVRGTAGNGGVFMYGSELANILTGGAGRDTLDGKAGDDRLIGGAGADKLTGGAGRDTFVFGAGSGNDTIVDFRIGEDSIDWSGLKAVHGAPNITEVSGTAIATFGTNTIGFTGVTAAALIAAKVFDSANPSGMIAGGGTNPVITPVATPVVTPVVTPAPVTTPAPVATPTPVTTPAPVATPAPVVSTAPAATPTPAVVVRNLFLDGTAGDNVLTGGAGNDTLIGRGGADTMSGGAGNDWYSVDHVRDVVIEKADEGRDSIQATVDYTLGANVENLTLVGSATNGTGNVLDNVIIGNDRNNLLYGLEGNDWLDGGTGADTMTGGVGNDSYVVDNVRDVIVELAGGGWDQMMSSVDNVVANNVEQLSLSGTAIRATANASGSYLNGNELNNILTGAAGNDTINGKLGNDSINGGGGNDRLTGGEGKDVFIFDGAFGRDIITDFKAGEDRIDWSALKTQYGDPVLKTVGSDVVAAFGANMITLLGVNMTDINNHHVFA